MDDELRTLKPMPLDGIRVVEFGTFHAGPGASAILGDLGAEVIKIEEAEGDPMRNWKEVGGIRFTMADGEGFPFQFTNRNKRGIWLNIKEEKGREIFRRLIQSADVFLTNLRKSTKQSMGLDYAAVSAINPRIIHASVSGFGQEGHLSDQGAFDPMGQARSGMMFSTGSDRPRLVHLAVLDQDRLHCAEPGCPDRSLCPRAPRRGAGRAHLPLRHGPLDAVRRPHDCRVSFSELGA